MLISSPRHTREDLRVWAERQAMDDAYLARCGAALQRRAQAVQDEVRRFYDLGACYLGVSWGKDSVVVADLVADTMLPIPMVWIRVKPIDNPDCERVRNAFLHRWPSARYHEIVVWCRRDPDGWHATGTLENGFARAAEIAGGRRHISGIRSSESGPRKLRVMAYGLTTANTCAPIGRWSGAEVFAFLRQRDLPVHPAYACSLGGTLERERIRVSSLGGKRGTGRGRAEWEHRYYADALRAIDNMTALRPIE